MATRRLHFKLNISTCSTFHMYQPLELNEGTGVMGQPRAEAQARLFVKSIWLRLVLSSCLGQSNTLKLIVDVTDFCAGSFLCVAIFGRTLKIHTQARMFEVLPSLALNLLLTCCSLDWALKSVHTRPFLWRIELTRTCCSLTWNRPFILLIRPRKPTVVF